MRLFASVAVLSLALATSVLAQATSGGAPEPSATQPAPVADHKPAADKKDGLVCRRETPTGSHFPVKVCTTAEQRKAQRSMAQRAQETMHSGNPVIPN